RRTCETMLASMGISRDLRAQIQSHGLSGIQQRHYDKHDYLSEKRAALDSWNRRLDKLIEEKEPKDKVETLETGNSK
ncbi:integrase, partial [Granulosicoccus sp.]|nr:integrase [Granulosicoccus sp.]